MIYLMPDGSVIYDDSYTSDEIKAKGWAVESLPLEEEKPGFIAVLKFDFSTKKIWYEYEPVSMTIETELELVRVENSEMKLALAELAESQERERLNTQLALAELAESMMGGNA